MKHFFRTLFNPYAEEIEFLKKQSAYLDGAIKRMQEPLKLKISEQ